MTTKAAALAAYRKACESHRRADWRMACHMMAEVLGADVAKAPARKPESLVQFLAKRGLRDDGGELTARDAEIWHKGRPFQRKLVRADGVTLEEAATLAHEAGYFPHAPVPAMDSGDNMHPVTGDQLLEAIERELAGTPVHALDDLDDDYWHALEQEERAAA